MGFDLYGLKPYNPYKAEKPLEFDWALDHTEAEKKAYFDSVDAYQTVVTGSYFRNNVWWWRPLWMFISMQCDDILTEEDLAEGGSNSGHKICKTKAKRVASRIRRLDKEGVIESFQKTHDERRARATKHNNRIMKKKDALNEVVKEYCGVKSIAPMDYPPAFSDKWEELQEQEKWEGHYPFNADNVREFGEFCDNSGGFEIC